MNKRNRTYWSIGVLVVAVAVLGGLYISNPSIFSGGKSNIIPPAKNAKELLNNIAYFPIPDSKSSTPATIADLGRDLQPFVLFDATNVVINKESYADGSAGFSIIYQTSKSVYDTYIDLLNIGKVFPFQEVIGAHPDMAAIVTTESPKHKVKILSERSPDGNTKVTIQVQIKIVVK